jgi:hypothetical protein
MKCEYRLALEKGLPFPLLTVAEYFTLDSEGFAWGRTYREAGYYTSIFLWYVIKKDLDDFCIFICLRTYPIPNPSFNTHALENFCLIS